MGTGIQRKLDYSDFAALPADGKRHELLDGRLHVTPAPSSMHQWASVQLEWQLGQYLRARKSGFLLHAPLDVILAPNDIVEPDIVVIADRAQISPRGIEGAPLLVVEILSPSTAAVDRGTKSVRYATLGVLHYWIVDPALRQLECYQLDGAEYVETARAEGARQLAVPGWPDLTVNLGPLWL